MADADRKADETIKETIESIVIAFVLAFVFRAYVVEAFVIPTGSMAPTLLGAHVSVACDQCGYGYTFDPPQQQRGDLGSLCPMCHAVNTLPAGARRQSGDRILVHKYVYSFSDPRRWDVVVFKNPSEPHENYIKRLVGLPNEQLRILDGNLYTLPDGAPDDSWQIARKVDPGQNPQWEAVQRAVFRPIYHSQYLPLDGGNRQGTPDWTTPWRPRDTAAPWDLNGRSYRYTGAGPGTIAFDMKQLTLLPRGMTYPPTQYPYNQLNDWGNQDRFATEPVEEVRIAATLDPAADGVSLTLSTTGRFGVFGDPGAVETLAATLQGDGQVVLESIRDDGTRQALKPDYVEATSPVVAGEHRAVELWYVDQAVLVWLDGEVALRWAFDRPFLTLAARTPPPPAPQVSLTVGGAATLHAVEVDRDLYYSDHVGSTPARGAWRFGQAGIAPVKLGDNEFFCVGDNGPRSSDGRFWTGLDDWVQTEYFPHRTDAAGVVPGRLMMGRAFFVYFPAAYHWGGIPLPNFGDMRFIH